MLLNCFNDPKKTLPAALLTMVVGLLMVTCGATWQRALGPALHLSVAQNDFFHGFCIGLGLSLEVAAVVVLARLAAVRQNQ